MTAGGEGVIGRREQLAAVVEFLNDPSGLPGALFLEGEAGIGKTTVWRAGVEEASACGYVALACASAATETRLAYTALGDLFGGVLDEVLAALPPPQRHAMAVALLVEDPLGAPPEPRAIATACLGAIRALARCGPVLIAVDDVQWLDRASASALEFAARRLGQEPVAFLLARRVEIGGLPRRTFERALGERRRTVAIGGLSLGAIHRILHVRLGLALARPVLNRLNDTVRGNPYFAIEIGRRLKESGVPLDPASPLPVGGDLSDLLRRRVRRLSPAGREALLAAAVLAVPSEELVEALSGSGGIEEARTAGMLDVRAGRLIWAHPLLAETVYADATPGRRREMHRRAAELVADPQERGLHLARAWVVPDATVAAELEAAAEHAVRRGAPIVAGELLERSAALTPAGEQEERTRRTVGAASHYIGAGNEAQARGLLDRLLEEGVSGHTRAEALLILARSVVDREQHRRLCEEALACAGDDEHRIQILSALSYAAMHDLDLEQALATAGRGAALAERSGNARLLGSALAQLGWMSNIAGRAQAQPILERAAALAPELDGLTPYYTPTTHLGWSLVGRGEPERARGLLEANYRHAVETGNDHQRRWLLAPLTELEWRAGDLGRAAQYAQDAFDYAEQLASPHSLSMFCALRGLVEVYRGDSDFGMELAEQALDFAREVRSRFFEARAEVVLALAQLAAGDSSAAARRLLSVDGRLRGAGVGDARLFFCYEGDLVEALVSAGELEHAQSRVALLERIGDVEGRAVARRAEGLLLATEGQLPSAIAALEASLELYGRLTVPFERARGLLLLGQVQRRAKLRRAARASLEEASECFDRIGARRFSERAAAETSRLGGRTASRDQLTPSEQRIAALVAQGRTNKEVAAELFVTVHTVEAALTRVYAKLEVRSRSELAGKLPLVASNE